MGTTTLTIGGTVAPWVATEDGQNKDYYVPCLAPDSGYDAPVTYGVSPGQTLVISASGTIYSGSTGITPFGISDPGDDFPSDAAGWDTEGDSTPDACCLMGCWADASGNVIEPLKIWAGTVARAPAKAFRLQLGINDKGWDKTGSFSVTIRPVPEGTAFVIDGECAPWFATSTGQNKDYYVAGLNSSSAKAPAAWGPLIAGDTVTATYISGTVSINPSLYSYYNARGGPTGSSISDLMSWDDLGQSGLCGAFTDGQGNIVGDPLDIGLYGSWTVPEGATQIQFGVNDGTTWLDNKGSFSLWLTRNAGSAGSGGDSSYTNPTAYRDPQIILQVSNDGGETWSFEKSASLGKLGAYSTLVRWRRLGRSNNRCFRVICSEPVQVALIAADLDLEAADR